MKRRILVVEDQNDSRRIMRDLLGSAGYEVLEARTGIDAVHMAEAERPDLILMDLQLPVIDGLEATRRIKAIEGLRNTPVVAVTSYALSGDNEKAMAAGCDSYFSKPVSPRTLLAKINTILSKPTE